MHSFGFQYQRLISLFAILLLILLGRVWGFSQAHSTQKEPPTQNPKKNSWPMYGGDPSRNMANLVEKKLLTDWHVEKGKFRNILWVTNLGKTSSYATPVVADGKVFIGTSNRHSKNIKQQGHKAILMAFRESDAKFLWQAEYDMPPEKIVREALQEGLCSTPTVVDKKVYLVTPAAKVICGSTETGQTIWSYDMIKEQQVFPCFLCNCSPLVVGDLVFFVTGNGTNEEGKLVSPNAPSFLALNKKTGKPVWKSNLPGNQVIEGQWSSPAYAEVEGKGQVIFGGGDAYLYGLEAETGKLLWKFHCNLKKNEAKQRERGLPNYLIATPVVYDNKVYIGIGLYPSHIAGNRIGHFWCVDLLKATRLGKTNKNHDVTYQDDNLDPKAPVNKSSALAWHFGGPIIPRPQLGRTVYFGRTLSTAAIHGGLVYISEEMGYLHCLDAKTGKKYWEHDFLDGIWGSPYYADGKVYIGTESGDVVIFQAGKTRKILNTIYMEDSIFSSPVAANGRLYIATRSKLFCIGSR